MSPRPATTLGVDAPSPEKDHVYVSWPSENRLMKERVFYFGVNPEPFQALAQIGLGPTHIIFSDEASRNSRTYAEPFGNGVVLDTRSAKSVSDAVKMTIRDPDGVLTQWPYLELDVNTDVVHTEAEKRVPVYEQEMESFPYEKAVLDITNDLVIKSLIAASRYRRESANATLSRKVFCRLLAASIAVPAAMNVLGASVDVSLPVGMLGFALTLGVWSVVHKSPDETGTSTRASYVTRNVMRIVRQNPPFAIA